MSDLEPPLVLLRRQLTRQTPLSDADLTALMTLPSTERRLEPAAYLVREGELPRFCALLRSGYAFRQKLSSDGARQIVSLHIPGDLLDFQNLYLECADHNVQALTRADVVLVPRAAVQDLIEERPAVGRAIFANVLREASIAREWLLNIGRRDARTRLAHLLCEFGIRLNEAGLSEGDEYELPMTQEQLGDALGLTSVHVNRTLKSLEAEGVLTRQGRRVQFTNWKRMRRIADFSALYLHLGAPPRRGRDH